MEKEALFYERLEENVVRCNLCAHKCTIANGEKGMCRVRINQGGTLSTQVYGRTVIQHIDAIEKYRLYHYLPDSTTYTVATPGCNLSCSWCPKWEIARMPDEDYYETGRVASPDDLVASALASGCQSITYATTEPTVYFEYAYETAGKAKATGLANILSTNGTMTREAFIQIAPYIDAIHVDLKTFRKKILHNSSEINLDHILDNLILCKEIGIWLEVSMLILPGVNDDIRELQWITHFLSRKVGVETPLHIQRLYPGFRTTKRQTPPAATMMLATKIAYEAGMQFVYLDTLLGETNTVCPYCQELLIRRGGSYVVSNYISNSCCPSCGTLIAGIWGEKFETEKARKYQSIITS